MQIDWAVPGELLDSAPMAHRGEWSAIRGRMSRDGYVYLRGALDRAAVLEAGFSVATFVDEQQLCQERGITLTGLKEATHSAPKARVLEGKSLRRIFDALFDERSETLDTKWVRVVGEEEQTSVHSDAFFFHAVACAVPAASPRLLVCWTPLEDVPRSGGPLAICAASHLLADFDVGGVAAAACSGGAAVELPAGFAAQARCAEWRTADFRAGDVLVFDIRTIHGSLRGRRRQRRISVDTRWYAAARPPAPLYSK